MVVTLIEKTGTDQFDQFIFTFDYNDRDIASSEYTMIFEGGLLSFFMANPFQPIFVFKTGNQHLPFWVTDQNKTFPPFRMVRQEDL